MTVQVKHRWTCQECELVSLWDDDSARVNREAEKHTKAKGHPTTTLMIPAGATRSVSP